MIIKNYETEQFGRFLFDLTLKGTQSRMRSRFVKLLQVQLDIINEERQQLINDYAKKDENNEFVYEESDGGMKGIIITDPKEYNNEIMKLMSEDFIIEETSDKVEMLKQIKEIVLNCDLEFSGDDAMTYDRWCELVEDIELN